jgi:catechol 2,3-dioxygenase-like lactoylglutathione lyase family enzyme
LRFVIIAATAALQEQRMAVIPHTIDIVVGNMEKSLSFYRTLGLAAPPHDPDQPQVQIATPGGATLGLILESAMREHDPHWVTPVGQRVTFSCRCDSPGEVDAVFARMTRAGFTGLKAPWNAMWGQRYAFLADPDGNRVDIFAANAPEGEE